MVVPAIVVVIVAVAGFANYGWIGIFMMLTELFCSIVISLAAMTGRAAFGPYSGVIRMCSTWTFVASMSVAPAAGLCLAAYFAPFSTEELHFCVALASGAFCKLHMCHWCGVVQRTSI